MSPHPLFCKILRVAKWIHDLPGRFVRHAADELGACVVTGIILAATPLALCALEHPHWKGLLVMLVLTTFSALVGLAFWLLISLCFYLVQKWVELGCWLQTKIDGCD